MRTYFHIRPFVLLSLAASLALFFVPNTRAAVISANFQGNQGSNALVEANSAGVVFVNNWNDVTTGTVSNVSLNDNTGAATSAKISYSGLSLGQGNGTNFSQLGNTRLMAGNIFLGGNAAVDLDFTGIPYSQYDLYVYFDGSVAANQTQNYTVIGGPTLLGNDGGLTNESAFVQSINGSQGDYVLFTGLTLSSFTLRSQGVGNQYAYLNGVQFVETTPVPEPSSVSLLGLGAIVLARRVRSRARSAR